MKRVFLRITAAIAIAGALSSCGTNATTDLKEGEVAVLAPKLQSTGQYSLDFVHLEGIADLETMSGKYARFYMSPRITNNKLQGRAPVGRFIKTQEGQIPANDLTQQMVSIYSHLQNLAQLDDELGAQGVNTWPRDVGIAVRAASGSTNNAFYDGSSDSMLFVPYTQKDLAIAINGGILAHEHFHSLFYKLVLKDTPFVGVGVHAHEANIVVGEELSKSEVVKKRGPRIDDAALLKVYQTTLIRAINEGLADFWGWMYTGDPDFIAQSLPSVRQSRSLQPKGESSGMQLPKLAEMKRNISMYYAMSESEGFDQYVMGYAYSLASQFSRFMKRFSDVSAEARAIAPLQSRKETGKLIVKMLPLLQKRFTGEDNRIFTSMDLVADLLSVIPDLKKEECNFIELVVNTSDEHPTRYFKCVDGGSSWKLVFDKADIEEADKAQIPLLESPNK